MFELNLSGVGPFTGFHVTREAPITARPRHTRVVPHQSLSLGNLRLWVNEHMGFRASLVLC